MTRTLAPVDLVMGSAVWQARSIGDTQISSTSPISWRYFPVT
eukprot:CAMPEP_0182545552 /NCGR_PEP_ID=MMETSP1323-20130603/34687_1 /TAXON_ID=236787 /ORGANISM="Florenciella parvula, Strain RCC1693" /LENGTH=41 /DNA_ID= /DNA_START= /DNA_END= /DNA_ORIENTATION=